MKCFHHNDLDGRCAGFWVHYKENLLEGNNIEMIEIDYKDEFPMDSIKQGERVYIVDFSIYPETMRELLKITKDIVWIDHHESAVTRYKDFEHELPGVRKIGIAGCVLTYIYLFIMNDKFDEDMVTKVPMFTRLIGDRDVWAWVFEDRTRDFCNGLMIYDTSPTSDLWTALLNHGTKAIEQQGQVVTAYRKVSAMDYLKSYAFETEFEGYKVIACNAAKVNSEFFEAMGLDGIYDIMMPFVWDGSKWVISMYSTKIDVQEIAMKYGGGGHKGAAGFMSKELPFK